MDKKSDSHENVKNTAKAVNRADIILIVIILLVAAAAIAVLRLKQRTGYKVELRVDGNLIKELSLDSDASYCYESENGTNTVVIKNHEAYVTDADCPDKICEDYKPISKVGEVIICLPHKLVVEVVD